MRVLRLEYYFRETAAGLRRNGIVAFAAMSTAFIALFLFGLALFIARQFNLVIEAWTGNVQVAVYLNDPARPDTVTRIQSNLEQLDAVGSIEYWDKAATCDHFNALFEGQEVFSALARRLPAMTLVEEPVHRDHFVLRGYRQVLVST